MQPRRIYHDNVIGIRVLDIMEFPDTERERIQEKVEEKMRENYQYKDKEGIVAYAHVADKTLYNAGVDKIHISLNIDGDKFE